MQSEDVYAMLASQALQARLAKAKRPAVTTEEARRIIDTQTDPYAQRVIITDEATENLSNIRRHMLHATVALIVTLGLEIYGFGLPNDPTRPPNLGWGVLGIFVGLYGFYRVSWAAFYGLEFAENLKQHNLMLYLSWAILSPFILYATLFPLGLFKPDAIGVWLTEHIAQANAVAVFSTILFGGVAYVVNITSTLQMRAQAICAPIVLGIGACLGAQLPLVGLYLGQMVVPGAICWVLGTGLGIAYRTKPMIE